MAETPKVLGQANPSAATSTTAYTVPASTNAIVSTIVVTNRSGTATSYRINIDPAGGGDSNEQYIAYDTPISGNESHYLTIGATLETTDLVRVYATLATLAFNIFGTEIT